MNSALSGIRVIDLTTEVSGPTCTMTLGDYGAEVIKVESLTGDPQRQNGVIFKPTLSSIFLNLNRNKKSLSINLKSDEGKAILVELIKTADIFIHNMRLAAIDKLGFDYEFVKSINPKIIYCYITGFDQDGPYRERPAYDDVIQAASGLTSLNDPPAFLPTILADKTTGIVMANAVMAALFYREKTGIGQKIELPMFETMTSFAMVEHMGELCLSENSKSTGYARILSKGRKIWKTKDGYFSMLPYTATHWTSLFELFNEVELGKELGVSVRETRNNNIIKVYEIVQSHTPTRTTDEWLSICDKLDIPSSVVNTINDLITNEQLKEVDLFTEINHEKLGLTRNLRPTAKLSETPATIKELAPHLGKDTVPVLESLGLDNQTISNLLVKNIIRN